uniref:Cyclin N-terminal domain-containing protein n=1 Tax=Latimeria chalumnae TaxID=7897 RepID=H2ZXH6_LATCH
MHHQLLCLEVGDLPRAQRDPVLLETRTLWKLLQVEGRYLPSASYFQNVQREIQPGMRKVLTGWMLEVCEEQDYEEIFPLAVNCLDRFLSLISLEKSQLQLLGSTCLFLASKLKETNPLMAETLCAYSDFSFTYQELKSMEVVVLKRLKWDLAAVSPQDFLPFLLHQLPCLSEKRGLVLKHTYTFIALCTTASADHNFIAFPPSVVAAASLLSSVCGLQLHHLWGPSSCQGLIQLFACTIRCDPEFLEACQEQLERILESSLRQAQWSRIPEAKSAREPERSSTPTDVRDINL